MPEGTSTAVRHTTRIRLHDAWQAHAACDFSTRINWRAGLVPAAAVLPAPIACTQVAAVEKLVAELGRVPLVRLFGVH